MVHGLKHATLPSLLTLIFRQVSVLEDLNKPGRKVCVANTHLYWHPKGKTNSLICMNTPLIKQTGDLFTEFT